MMFIHREDQRFTVDEWERQYPDRDYPAGLADLIVAKHRHGPLGNIGLRFNGAMARFEDLPTSRDM